MRFLFPAAIFALLFAGCTTPETTPPAPAPAQPTVARTGPGYAIRLSRPDVVDESYHVVCTGSSEDTMVFQTDGTNGPSRGKRFRYEIIADCKVLAVTSQGNATKLQLVVEKLTRTTGIRTVPLLPPGTTVVARKGRNGSVFTVNDLPVAPVVAEVLEEAGLRMSGDDNASDDAIFGTKELKYVGDSWPIDAKAAAADLRKDGIPAEAKNLTGTVNFNEVVQTGDGTYLRLSADLAMKGVNPPVPPGLKVDSSVFVAKISGLFPADASGKRMEESTALSMEVKATGTQNGRPATMIMTKKSTREMKGTRN